MTAIAFRYRLRRPGAPLVAARAGEAVRLDENAEYYLEFAREPSEREWTRLTDVGVERLTPKSGLLTFINFVGRVSIAGAELSVHSTKLGDAGVEGLLARVAALSAELVYSWDSPTAFATAREAPGARRIAYHELHVLRHAMLGERVGSRLQDAFSAVADNPVRQLVSTTADVLIDRVRVIDSRSITRGLSTHHVTKVDRGSPWYEHPLTARLAPPGSEDRFMLTRVSEPVRRVSFDTPENRFVQTVLAECAEVAARFSQHAGLNQSIRRDCRQMLEALEAMRRTPFLDGVPRLTGPIAPSQALLKRDGYRWFFEFHRRLVAGTILPLTSEEVEHFLDGRDVPTLYEYFVFLVVVDELSRLMGDPIAPPRLEQVSELGVSMARCTLRFAEDVSVSYNRCFGHQEGGSYSLPFRPDVTVLRGTEKLVLDAKYRLDRFTFGDDMVALDRAEREEAGGTFKRADLYKMHTYRDAIAGVGSAWAVYPGTEFRFYESSGEVRDTPEAIATLSGVGGVPLHPQRTTDELNQILASFLGRKPS